MKATSEKQRPRSAKRDTGGTRTAAKKKAGTGAAGMRITEHVVQFEDGSKIALYAPTAKTSLLKKKVAEIKGVRIVEGLSGRVAYSATGRATDQIITMATTLAGSKAKAQDWYRTFPIPAFGGVTAEFLVEHGRAKEVRDYLNAVVLGEFA